MPPPMAVHWRASGDSRGGVADPVAADPDHITQIRAADPARGQLAPDWLHYPMVAFATVATVIASQAIISGVFSLTQQSIQLGFLPRMQIKHTTSHSIGQIYVPLVNWLLAAATLGAVIGFETSDALAGAYGIAVSLLMAITTLLAALVAIQWGYPPVVVIAPSMGSSSPSTVSSLRRTPSNYDFRGAAIGLPSGQAAWHRSHRYHLLHRPRDHHSQPGCSGHVGVAGNRVRVPAAQRRALSGVLWGAYQAGRRVRYRNRDLALT
jgi:hypothetical protein